jgi:hypothetical protein
LNEIGKNLRNAEINLGESHTILELFASIKRIASKLGMRLNQPRFNIFKHSLSTEIACSLQKHKDLEIKDLY